MPGTGGVPAFFGAQGYDACVPFLTQNVSAVLEHWSVAVWHTELKTKKCWWEKFPTSIVCQFLLLLLLRWLVSRRAVGAPHWTNVCDTTLVGWTGGLCWAGDKLGHDYSSCAGALKSRVPFLPVDALSFWLQESRRIYCWILCYPKAPFPHPRDPTLLSGSKVVPWQEWVMLLLRFPRMCKQPKCWLLDKTLALERLLCVERFSTRGFYQMWGTHTSYKTDEG